jgi:formylglycine-generating enzyme required for sulfatase activity
MVNVADGYALAKGGERWSGADASLDDGSSVHARVGSYPANGFGLHEVIGNLWEWCEDRYDEFFYLRGPRRDPVARGGSSTRLSRGGGFGAGPALARSAFRESYTPDAADGALGVRPARALRLATSSTMPALAR